MKREPYPTSTEPNCDLRIDYFLANAEITRSLCEKLGYVPEGPLARPPAGKRGPQQRPEPKLSPITTAAMFTEQPENVVAFPVKPSTPPVPKGMGLILILPKPEGCETPPPEPPALPPTPSESNLPPSDSGGAGAP